MSNQLVSNLTVDELKDVIASVVDNRLDNLLRLLNTDFAIRTAELKTVPNPYIAESTKYLAEYKSELKEDNPWLKIAGIHKNNPLFESVTASIEADRQDSFEEDLI
jgi:hypothetical protein